MTATPKTKTFTDPQATDEALLLLVRKLRRLHPETYTDLLSRLPEGARRALNHGEMRAEILRDERITKNTIYTYPAVADLDGDGATE